MDADRFYRVKSIRWRWAYVPWQYWNAVYDLEKGLAYGTIFPELNKPFLGVRGGLR